MVMKRTKPVVCIVAGLTALLFAATVMAQQRGRRPARFHTATESAAGTLVPATETAGSPRVSIRVSGTTRTITSNGIPSHPVGDFPNRGNPHTITPQDYAFTVTTQPARTSGTTASRRWLWGVAVNGVPFEAPTAEFWHGHRGGWNYDALGGAVRLGLDANHAHVQRGGAYHYHSLPTGLMRRLDWKADAHSPLIGWAADGFPIYAIAGDLGNGVRKVRSSYRLKPGARPGGDDHPGGAHDGAFVQDWHYVAGSGDLDECNGAVTRSAEFPDGSYAYFITEGYPFVARCWKGTPDPSFRKPRRR